MLAELRIQDFAVIDSVRIEFGPGLNTLTGETGAGKSIIVDALTAALGARASAESVRTGATAARVEARFVLDRASAVQRYLVDQGITDDELVVAREIASDGRSRGWINGRPATIGMLRDLGELLVEVMGQHESQRLLRPQTHLEVLDAFGGAAVEALRAEVADLVARRTALRAEWDALRASEQDRLRRTDLLQHQVREIEAARLQPGEDEILAVRRSRLVNAERLSLAAARAYGALYDADDGAAVDRLGQARATLREVAAVDPLLGALADRLQALTDEVVEVARELNEYRSRIEHRPEELEAVEERLALIQTLRRKYGDTIEEILAVRDRAVAELAALESCDSRGAEIGPQLVAIERDLADRCTRLSEMRREAAARLEASVAREFGLLELKRARLTIAVGRERDPDGLLVGEDRVAVGPSGIDRVEFLLAANPGEDARPLARIASGGELSRVMLALRHVLAATGGVPVVVFDEVETGIGARTAGAVGQVLLATARTRQVLCITHLAEIASLGDHHFWVTKEVIRGRTIVKVQPLAGKDRVEEIARMLSGRLPTPIAREYATELLAQARRKRGVGAASRKVPGGTS
jgi:DNA repair protein RecN (Recombination protein N)